MKNGRNNLIVPQNLFTGNSFEQLQTVFDTLPCAFAFFNVYESGMQTTEFVCKYINDEGLSELELTKDDVIGIKLQEIFHYDSEALLTECNNINRGYSPGKITVHFSSDRTFDIRIAKLNEGISLSWKEINANVEDKIIDSIAERKKVEEALKQSEERFFKAFIISPYAMSITKLPERTWYYVNDSFLKLTGYSREELIGHTSSDFNIVVEQEPNQRIRIIDSLTKEGRVTDEELYIRDKDGLMHNVILSAVIIEHEGVRYAITQHVDITGRKTAEEKVRENEAKLLDAQKLARLGNYSYDLRNNSVEWSDQMYELWEIDKQNPVPPFDELWDRIHPDDRKRINTALSEVTKENDKIEIEYRILFPENRVKYVLLIARNIFDEAANVIKRVGVVLDITERKEAILKLEHAFREIELSKNDIEQYAFVTSHDLKEPIRMINSYSQLLAKKYKDKLDEDAGLYLKFIGEGASRLHLLVNDLFNYSQIGIAEKNFIPVNTLEIIESVLTELKKEINENNAVIEFSNLPVIYADPSQLKKLFNHLICNAIKFRSKKDPVININCVDYKSDWLFSVKDNGIGFEKTYDKIIFSVFQRLNTREEYSGNGVGLAICKRIVGHHNGSIWAESEPGKGSTFYFTIPQTIRLLNNSKY